MFIDEVNNYIISKSAEMSKGELLVMEVLIKAFNSKVTLTQKDIIAAIREQGGCIGNHARWEKNLSKLSSTERQLRMVIESLRKCHNIPICSSSQGYYLPESDGKLREYMSRAEKASIAAAKSHVGTFNAIASVWAPDFRTRIGVLPVGEGTVDDSE